MEEGNNAGDFELNWLEFLGLLFAIPAPQKGC